MVAVNYKDYRYKGITKNEEGDCIGHALFKSGYVKEDLTEIDPENVHCMINKEPLKDVAKIFYKEGEYFICKIHYSKRGNYLGDEQEFFYIPHDCDCQDFENGMISMYCSVHNENPYEPD